MELDMALVRAFVATADELHFGRAAERLYLSQQALSKRVRRLEEVLSVRLLERSSQRVDLTEAGRVFLPHAIQALAAADAAVAAVQQADRTIRIDVLDERLAPMSLVRRLLERDGGLPVEVSMLHGLDKALPAVQRGELDAAFGRVHELGAALPRDLAYRLAMLEPLVLLVGAGHRLTDADLIRMAELRDVQLWVPIGGGVAEWASFVRQFAADWELSVDFSGPSLSLDYVVDEVCSHPTRATLVGARMALSADERTRLIPIVEPRPMYPWSLVWRRGNAHPLLGRLLEVAGEGLYTDNEGVGDPARAWLPEADRVGLGQRLIGSGRT